jgi:hypothetical protein
VCTSAAEAAAPVPGACVTGSISCLFLDPGNSHFSMRPKREGSRPGVWSSPDTSNVKAIEAPFAGLAAVLRRSFTAMRVAACIALSMALPLGGHAISQISVRTSLPAFSSAPPKAARRLLSERPDRKSMSRYTSASSRAKMNP